MGIGTSAPVHRSFVLIGSLFNGKSTLGNLILGGALDSPFRVHVKTEGQCCTRQTEVLETTVKSTSIFGDKVPEEDIRIQVIDQPGFGDIDFSLENYSKFLIDCLKNSNAEISTTFLITIKMSSQLFTDETVSGLFELVYFMAKFKYNFFSNAMVVFTHIDEIKLREGISLDQELRELTENENWTQLTEILQRVDNRHMFVNARNRDQGYREKILQTLFEISKPVIKATFHGNNNFTGAEMRKIIQGSNESISHPKCHLQCTFSEDFQTSECLNLEAEVLSSFNRMKQVGHGISVVIILINLHKYISKQTLKLINALPGDYQFGEDNESEFWKYVFILFKLSAGQNPTEHIDKHVGSSVSFQEIFEKIGRRYTYVTDEMTRDECVNRILEVSQSIKQKNEGREYINAEIVSNMEKTISKMRSAPPPKVQPEGAANLQPGPAYTYSQMFTDAGMLLLKVGFATAVSGGDPSFVARSLQRKRWEVKYARKISDEEFKKMVQKMDT